MELLRFKFPTWSEFSDVVWEFYDAYTLQEVHSKVGRCKQWCAVKRWEDNVPVVLVVSGNVEHIGVRVHDTDKPEPTTKPSNPKDAVGSKKVSMSVLPANVLMEVALGLQEGALKYGRHNYRAVGVRASVYYDATLRHLMAFWEGEDIDPDSQLSHVTKAISSLIVLRDSMLRENWTDDRPPKSSENWIGPLNERASALVQRYAGTEVKHYFEKEDA